MFTGIVNETAQIISIKKKQNLHSYTVQVSPLLSKNLKIGASVANNGCCLTVKSINQNHIVFDIILETLKSTNLGSLNVGDYVNIERSVKYGDEIGGHIISGHVMNTATISQIKKINNNYVLWLTVNKKALMKYIFYKGFICIDGISLTIGKINNSEFCVNLIPETLLSTTIECKKIGDLVNIEIDFYTQIIVDTTKRFMNKNIEYF